jgi:hypothetical protein
MAWMCHTTRVKESRSACVNTLVGKTEGNKPLWRPGRGQEDNIKIDFKGIRCENMDCVHRAQPVAGFVNTVTHLWVA